MAILVDYLCHTCRGRTEAWVSSPPPAARDCPACGGTAKRGWAPVGLSGTPSGRSVPGPAGPPRPAADPLCVRNPDVLGLCHLSPSAGRAWVARARGDNRALDRELARQEAAARVAAPTMADAVSHDHGGGTGHAHAHP